MSNHKPRCEFTDGQWMGYCTCRQRSNWFEEKYKAEDWCREHLEGIARVRAYLAGTPSLKSQRDYFNEMAEDPNTSEADRLLWQQLANEITHRLGETPAETEPLFDIKE